MLAGGPSEKPAFLNRETAEAIGYIGGDEKPLFDEELRTENPEAPSAGLKDRYLEIARLHALGHTNNEICTKLNYTPAWMSTVLKDPFIQDEIQKYRDRLFDGDVQTRLKEAAIDGAKLIHNIILDGKEKVTTRLDAAKWANEKSYGKARQEVNVESSTLNNFLEMLREMRRRGESIDVTPGEARTVLSGSGDSNQAQGHDAAQSNRFDAWLADNLAD